MTSRVASFLAAGLAVCCGLLAFAGGSAAAQGLSITLTGLQGAGDACIAALDIGNDFGRALDRFSVDLIAIDSNEQPIDRVLFDLAPLPHSRTTTVSLPLALPCAAIGRLLIPDLPDCRIEGDSAMRDCHRDLRVGSRAAVPLTK